MNDETRALSNRLALEIDGHVNNLNLKEPQGKEFRLEESEKGIYQKSSYFDLLKKTVEKSFERILTGVICPYDNVKVE